MNNAKPSLLLLQRPAIFSIYFGHKPTDWINSPFSAASPSNWWPSFCSLGSASADQANSVDPREWESLQISINYSPSPRYSQLHHSNNLFRDRVGDKYLVCVVVSTISVRRISGRRSLWASESSSSHGMDRPQHFSRRWWGQLTSPATHRTSPLADRPARDRWTALLTTSTISDGWLHG